MRFLFAIFACALASTTAAAQESGFEAWLSGFRAEATAAGIRADILDEAFQGLTINNRVYELNDNQPEFSRAIWDYLDSAVSQSRKENARAKIAEHRSLLALIEQAYGVDAEIIVAIWGLESSFGAILGNYDAIQALATLAYDGRRTGYGRSQLIGALKILQNGYATREELKGSWAGAMGHTQFIPTTYLAYAIDHNGDGRRDIWNNLGDVFASTANYLSVSGYRQNEAWGVEVRLPADFDFALAGGGVRKPLVEWAALGATSTTNESLLSRLDPNLRSRLILPAGARGPAFLVFPNFDAILKYNRSTAYALAVSMLSEEAAGRSGAVATLWPRDDRPLSLAERKTLQQALTDRGYNPGPIDGIIGAGTKRALRAWQKDTGLPADGYASAAVLNALTP
ncbi:Membrane-bound lytic murein transglycosylase B (35 kDa soluble lytic transglycosylase) (Murein hydrolase B) (Slt35) [Durusdinium trenchii]|uniref:Membrane-bound lytic murein transglycosylase B (35 kDa soluble lytic transglycosylase) (Murein hydrolase B) (Slt35) n=1 Tax=Durusdinium trenchii TaxID=1381693 RepID=A0ABP0LV90_9DINO